MGWFRNRRRNKLKETLMKEGRLDQFRNKFILHIQKIDEQLNLISAQAKKAHQAKDDYQTRLLIHRHQESEELKRKLQALLATLEKASATKAAQETYHRFLDQLNEFKDAFSDQKIKRKDRRKLKRYKKSIKGTTDDLEWIDRRVEKLDKALDRKDNLTEKSLNKIDVEGFFNRD
jgi:uncharacterized membrane protein YdfJ with MMPL/SSD domain